MLPKVVKAEVYLTCLRLLAVNYFRKRSLPQLFDRGLNTPQEATIIHKIRDALRDLVPFVRFKKTWTTPMDECYYKK